MISRRSLFSQLGLLAVVGAGAWWLRDHVLWPSPTPVFADGTSSGWQDFVRPLGDVPTIPVRIGGAMVDAVVDSGAQSSVIDRALAQKLGLPTTVIAPLVIAFGISGAPQLGRTARMEVVIAGLTLKGLHAAVFDLASIAAASGRSFGLILGQDVLKRLVADLDLPGARLAFHAQDGYAPPAEARDVPVRVVGRALSTQVRVEDTALEAVIDTGAAATLSLSMDSAQAAGLLDGRPVGSAPSITFGGLSHDRVVQVDSIGFAGQVYRDVPVHIFTPDRNAPLPTGLLGIGAFDRFRTILDAGRGRLHLAPSDPQV